MAPHVTISLGVAMVIPPDGDAQTLIAAADEALYASKLCGRNRVTAAQPATAAA